MIIAALRRYLPRSPRGNPDHGRLNRLVTGIVRADAANHKLFGSAAYTQHDFVLHYACEFPAQTGNTEQQPARIN
jgi:hypothetical protein